MPLQRAKRAALVHAASVAGRRWRTYLVAILALAAVIAAAVFVPVANVGQRYTGALLGVAAVLIVLLLAGHQNPASQQTAIEAWTLAPLRRARGWTVIDKLPFDRKDVAHVVLTPAAALAVECRYYAACADGDAERLAREVHSAERAAQKVRLLVRIEGLRSVAPVVPVLIVWGPGAPKLVDGHELRGDVHLVDGAHPRLWMPLFNDTRLSTTLRRDLQQRFARHATRNADSDERVMKSLRVEMWQELKSAILEERAQRAKPPTPKTPAPVAAATSGQRTAC